MIAREKIDFVKKNVVLNPEDRNIKMLQNPEGNPCYFTFTLVLKDTDETIYQSKMVEPGKAITQITLSKELSTGEYPAILKISTAALDDGRAMNGANVETVLNVQ